VRKVVLILKIRTRNATHGQIYPHQQTNTGNFYEKTIGPTTFYGGNYFTTNHISDLLHINAIASFFRYQKEDKL
jgi:hypothetical protein